LGVIGSPDGDFVVAEWSEPAPPPGPPMPIAPLHVHHEDDEAWFVLEGTLGFRLGDEESAATAGSGFFGPHGIPHTFWNVGPGPARYLVVMRPDTYRLIEELHATSDRSPEFLRALFARHGCELLA
jgi:mannose-6-phosphate isomerase-like protein (cupin superfamily)